ncbi:rhsC element core protein RshC, partial [Escherichia coli]
MSGKPAARQGDMTQYGGPIVQGSAGVRIGAPPRAGGAGCGGGGCAGVPGKVPAGGGGGARGG